MAIISNRVPEADGRAARAVPRRVVVKFAERAALPYSEAARETLARNLGRAWSDFAAAHPDVALKPYFESLGEATLRQMEASAARVAGAPRPARFTSYYAIECPSSDPEQVARQVAQWPDVETAYVEAGPTPPPAVNPGDDPRNPNQHYQDGAPNGIGARYAWGRGLDGAGVGFVDLEQGWTLNHEDLAAAGITLISGLNQAYPGHGTAVLGEVVGVDNALGGVGIAPAASARVVSQYRSATNYSTADAILAAVAVMTAGDVLLLEAQTTYGSSQKYVPVEVEQATFDAIQYATAHGIVVVEAGANGSVDLDAFTDASGRRILDRGSHDFRDSGAILVGAADSGFPHARSWFSNFGSRIDCYAWGQNIDTCGDGWTGTATHSYTASFGGTSGASPIVTGAALLMQAFRLRRGMQPYHPYSLRSLLSNATLNTPSANPAADRIGVMPDLRTLIEHEEVHFPDWHRWMAVLRILFGVVNDGGGVVWVGGRPHPVDPWGPLVTGDRRDVLVGMAVGELAALVGDDASRKELENAAAAVMRRGSERAGHG